MYTHMNFKWVAKHKHKLKKHENEYDICKSINVLCGLLELLLLFMLEMTMKSVFFL